MQPAGLCPVSLVLGWGYGESYWPPLGPQGVIGRQQSGALALRPGAEGSAPLTRALLGSLGTGSWAHVAAAAVMVTGGQASAYRAPWVPGEARPLPTGSAPSPGARGAGGGFPQGSSAGAALPPGRPG